MASIVPEGKVAWGIQLPIQALTLTIRDDWEVDGDVADLVTVAEAAEAAGAFFVGVCDHIGIPDNDYANHMSTTWYDPVATLSYLAAATHHVRLLSMVWIAPYRHPLQTAKSFGTLDHLSGGRAILGVGAGHVEAEFDALGVDFGARGTLLDEAIDGVRAAWSGDYSAFSGSNWQWSDIGISPRPASSVPIWVGGSSKPTYRRVATRGDGWIPMGNPPDQMAEIIGYIRTHAEQAGRADERLDLGFMPPWIYLGDTLPDGLREIPSPHLVGSPEQVAEGLRLASEVGANILHLHFRSRSREELCDQLAAFGRDVAPLLEQ